MQSIIVKLMLVKILDWISLHPHFAASLYEGRISCGHGLCSHSHGNTWCLEDSIFINPQAAIFFNKYASDSLGSVCGGGG